MSRLDVKLKDNVLIDITADEGTEDIGFCYTCEFYVDYDYIELVFEDGRIERIDEVGASLLLNFIINKIDKREMENITVDELVNELKEELANNE